MAALVDLDQAAVGRRALDEHPRVRLATLPTPLTEAPRLSQELDRRVLLKRDDLTGLAVGGNKLRKLEFLLADARERGADVVVTGGGPQSNHIALTAMAAARSGLDAHLVMYGDAAPPVSGNVLLQRLSGCEVSFTGSARRESVDAALDERAAELSASGRRPYVIPRGGATAVGSLGYARCGIEIGAQLEQLGIEAAIVVVAVGSGGTQAGLELGRLLTDRYEVFGVTVSRPKAECHARVRALSRDAAVLIGVRSPFEPRVRISDEFMGRGYGELDEGVRSAVGTVARLEAVLLDPVFTAKAMLAVLTGAVPGRGPIVFLHTGGLPRLFAEPGVVAEDS